jgi:CheY-like chemotaxis protein
MSGTTVQKRIFVVDDNKALADVTVRLLAKLGQEACAFYDGQSTLAALDHFMPDLIFLDIAMPEMDGYEIASRIRADSKQKDIVLVAVTGYNHPECLERVQQVGFDHHFVKPVRSETFKSIIEGNFASQRLQPL